MIAIDIETATNIELDAVCIQADGQMNGATYDPDLAAMNARFAVVKIGGKTRVVELEDNPACPGSKMPVFSTIADFCSFQAKRRKNVGTDDNPKMIGIGKWWIGHEHRRQYDGIVYAPGATGCASKLNLWTGFGCDPVPGDCSLYLEHLRNNICAGNEEYAAYLVGWMANAVQNPGSPGEVAVVLRGKEGTGKGVFAKEFGRLFGTHFKQVTHAKHLVGHFNAHLQQCSVLYADEAFFAGDSRTSRC